MLDFAEGGGSVDPRINSLVARALEEAKQKDVPMATIQAYFKRLVSVYTHRTSNRHTKITILPTLDQV